MNKNKLMQYIELTKIQFLLRDQSTFLGFLWSLLFPISLFIVLFLFFQKTTGSHVEHFPLFLLIGIVLWKLFESTTSSGMMVLVNQTNVLRNIKVDKIMLVFSEVSAVLVYVSIELLIVFLAIIFMGIDLTLKSVLIIPILILLCLMVYGIALILSLLYVFFRDVNYIWTIFYRVLFFLTPIFYPVHIIAENRRVFLYMNPMTYIIDFARDVLIYNKLPDLRIFSTLSILIIAFFAFSIYVFKKYENKINENL